MFLGNKSALSMFLFCVVEQTLAYESNWKMTDVINTSFIK